MDRHHITEDGLAILIGTIFVSLGLYFFNFTNLLTGGTAGLALLLRQLFDFSFGQIFFVINIPFFILGLVSMGKDFALRSLLCVSLVSLFTDNLPAVIQLAEMETWYAAICGGFLIGIGMLALIRHKCSLGGINILGLYLQKRFNWRAGNVQMLLDSIIVMASFILVPIEILLFSIVGAATLNIVVSLNHKQGRYMGVS